METMGNKTIKKYGSTRRRPSDTIIRDEVCDGFAAYGAGIEEQSDIM